MDVSQMLRRLADAVEAAPRVEVSDAASMRPTDSIIEGDLSEIATNVKIAIRPASKRMLKSLQSGKGAGRRIDPKLLDRLLAHEKEILAALEDPTFAAQFVLDPVEAVEHKLKNDELLAALRAARAKQQLERDAIVRMSEMTIRVEREVK